MRFSPSVVFVALLEDGRDGEKGKGCASQVGEAWLRKIRAFRVVGSSIDSLKCGFGGMKSVDPIARIDLFVVRPAVDKPFWIEHT